MEKKLKFLDAYVKADKDFFFGRDIETETLYQMTFKTRLTLVYGASGTGKTSLIQAGLANKFSPTRWKELFVRRNDNMMTSLRKTLQEELDKQRMYTGGDVTDLVQAVHDLNKTSFKPIYLIFDQFEELFVLRNRKENQEEHPSAPSQDFSSKIGGNQEQRQFFQFVNNILASEIPCKIILSMREEFLANLWPFEPLIPSLFDHRFRVESMRKGQIKEVIQGTLKYFKTEEVLTYPEPESDAITDQIFTNLSREDAQGGIELTYLQVYLKRIFDQAKGTPPLINLSLVQDKKNTELEDVIGDFLDDQIKDLEDSKGIKKGTPIRVLGKLVTEEQTKRIINLDHLIEELAVQSINKEEIEACLDAFVNMRILKPYKKEA